MNKYKITLSYTVQRSYTVKAESYEEAEYKAREGIGHHKNKDEWDYDETVENILCEEYNETTEIEE